MTRRRYKTKMVKIKKNFFPSPAQAKAYAEIRKLGVSPKKATNWVKKRINKRGALIKKRY